jgi:hypothetical protein
MGTDVMVGLVADHRLSGWPRLVVYQGSSCLLTLTLHFFQLRAESAASGSHPPSPRFPPQGSPLGMVSLHPALEAIRVGTSPAPTFTGATAALAQAGDLNRRVSALADIFALMSPAAFAEDHAPNKP